MAQCVTCGSELHPERAEKYNYCMAPDCQEKNLKGLTMVAIGVNKAAEQYLVLDENTQDELASGKYHDQRRGSFGTSVASAAPVPSATAVTAGHRTGGAQRDRRSQARPASPQAVRRPWSRSQEKLAVLYNQQGLRPEEIAQKLKLSPYTVTQIILASRNRAKL
jgi:DNA-binding NarL/FixJ family response regulator